MGLGKMDLGEMALGETAIHLHKELKCLLH
jgi:hypothetical protein